MLVKYTTVVTCIWWCVYIALKKYMCLKYQLVDLFVVLIEYHNTIHLTLIIKAKFVAKTHGVIMILRMFSEKKYILKAVLSFINTDNWKSYLNVWTPHGSTNIASQTEHLYFLNTIVLLFMNDSG